MGKERMPNRPTYMVDKRDVLCQDCFDSIPDESKMLSGEVRLKNSCSEYITEENRKLTMVKLLSKPWPPEEKKTAEDGVLPKDKSVGDGGVKRTRSDTPSLSDAGASKQHEDTDGEASISGASTKVKSENDIL